jgi:integrase
VKSFGCMFRFNGQLRRETFKERYPAMSLAEARRRAGEIFAAASEGRDPRLEKQERKEVQARANADLYAAAVDDFIERYAIAKKHNRSAKEQRRLLLKVDEAWHKRPVASITVRDIHDALDGIMERGHPYNANRTYEVLSTFFKWLDQRDRVPANPMTKIVQPFDGEAPRERAWNDDELARIWGAADKLDRLEAAYLRLTLLLGQRRGEVAEMCWDEVDLDAAIWTLPATRAKNKRAHEFPLSARAVELLRSLPRIGANPFVFAGAGAKLTGAYRPRYFGSRMQRRVQELAGVKDFTFHDARRTFRTGLDRLNIQPHIKLECLQHARQGVGDWHYSTYKYLDEQRAAFDAWSDHIGKLTGEPTSNVVQMQSKRRGKR